jgi:hypothetical protein
MNKKYWLTGTITGLIIGVVILLISDGMQECMTFSDQLSCVWLWSNVTAYREDELTLLTNILPLFIIGPMLMGAIIGGLYGRTRHGTITN